MNLRKINAGLSLICTILLMKHAISHALRMLSKGSISVNANGLAFVLFGLMLVHAMLSIMQAVQADTEEKAKVKVKGYPGLNLPTWIQRISGFLLIIFTVLHIAGTIGLMQPSPVVHSVVPPVFFTVALLHTAISTSKALITLGIGNIKFIKAFDIFMKVLCVATLIADIIGFYLFVA